MNAAFASSLDKTRHWDYRTPKAETGALPEYFRKLLGTFRTIQPFHTLSIAGQKALDFVSCQDLSSFGVGSPFDQLFEKSAIISALGIRLVGGATFLAPCRRNGPSLIPLLQKFHRRSECRKWCEERKYL